MPEQSIGRYRIESILGTGAMGVVYKAFDPHIHRVVALKTVRQELLVEDGGLALIERFRTEARAAGRLQHPGIVSVYDFGEDKGISFLAMEYVDGKPLHAIVREGVPADPALIARWMTQLLQALDYAHRQGVVHRDIKPGNLLVTADQRVKIADFGVARLDAGSVTHFGTVVGTPNYMSPEQFRGDPVDGRSDLFSVGVILFQLVTGRRPYSGSAATVMQQILNEEPPRASAHNPALPVPMDRFLARAMARRPQDRYPDAAAFLQDLRVHFQIMVDAQPSGADATVTSDAAPPARPSPETVPHLAGSPRRPEPTTPSASLWRSDTLAFLERTLALQIGPLAKVLVRKKSQKAADFEALASELAQEIPTLSGQKAFRDALTNYRKSHATDPRATAAGAVPGFVATGSGTATAPVTCGLSQEELDAIEKKLAAYVGPIARILVKRAARTSRDEREFYRLVTEQMTDGDARGRFLKDVGML